jgi:dienelactone hydrolase
VGPWLLLFWYGVIGSGIAQRGEVVFRPAALESMVPEPFRLEAQTFGYELQTVLQTPRYNVSLLRFPSPITSPDVENNVVHAEFFEPVGFGGKRPAVVVLHILGSDFPLSRYMAARLADRGVAALFLMLPYYGERRPREAGGARRFLSADIDRTTTSMRQGVCDVRRAIAWLKSRGDFDGSRLGVTGISLGGIVAALAVAVDPAAQEGVFLLAGGDLSQILWNMPEAKRFRESWLAAGRTLEQLKALTDPFDPLTYAHRLAGKRLLFIAGKVDEVVPPASTLALWKAAGRPPIHWYDCGHYSAAGYLLPAIRGTVDFLASPVEPPR